MCGRLSANRIHLPFLLCLPLAAVLLLMRRWFVPHNYRQLGIQLFIGGVVYGLGLLWVVMSKRALRIDDSSLQGRSIEAPKLVVSTPEEIYQQDV
jgi:hypothetical protein